MAKIAAATGGGYFELTSSGDLAGKFDRVIDELHHQYALGFAPQKARRQAARPDGESEHAWLHRPRAQTLSRTRG